MKPVSPNELKIRRVLNTLVLLIVVAYLSQAAFIHLRLNLMHAEKENLINIADSCDEANCTGKWSITPKAKLLLLGHLMRTHKLEVQDSGAQVFPISRVRGITADSWSGLRVYEVTPGSTYTLTITKPKAVKMGYFIGILPRSTNHEGVLSIPDISPTISTITTMAGFGLLGVLLFAAFLAPKTGANGIKNREELITIAVSAVAAAIVSAIGSGTVDSLMPDGEMRSRILRTSIVVAVLCPSLAPLLQKKIKSIKLSSLLIVLILTAIVNSQWNHLRAGIAWTSVYTATMLFMSHSLWKRKKILSAIVLIPSFWDPLFMSGFELIRDIPPTYLFQPVLISSLSFLVADLGATSVLGLASRAYSRFTRDIALSKIEAILSNTNEYDSGNVPETIKASLPLISNLCGAGRVSILINLPFARPITHSYTSNNNSFTTHDDGRIPGAVTIRAFVYGDEAWFEKYSDFSKRLEIPSSKHLQSSDYICIAPIRVNQNNMGVLMLTSFHDKHIDRLIRIGEIDEERETGKAVIDTLASVFSSVVLQNLKTNTADATSLMTSLRDAIPYSSSTLDFLQRFCDSVHKITGLRTMLHEWVGDQGVAICQAGFEKEHWHAFESSPFNLSNKAQKSFGPTVVAFREGKSSYLKDWEEIQEKLHPKTVEILAKIDTRTFLAVPLKTADSKFVLTMISKRMDAPKDPGIMKIIEGTEAIFDAAITVLHQKTSVLALGKLANRLIGDDDVREKIISAAKSETLPTTIGSPRTSFLLLFDLVGSSNLQGDTEHKAKCYGYFYDEVNKSVHIHLDGKIRKTIGDAIIATWDGSNTKLENHPTLLSSLIKVVERANIVAREFGCTGIRTVLHFGDYFFGLVGTSSFGQIDVIGKGIDEVCKLEGITKQLYVGTSRVLIAISSTASDRLPIISDTDWLDIGLPRLIAALLAELDASNAVVITQCIETGAINQTSIRYEFKMPFEESAIEIKNSDRFNANLRCTCCYAGQRISFELKKLHKEFWALPLSIEVQDLRSESRYSFLAKNFSAEIIGRRAVTYGYAIDINKDCLAIESSAKTVFKKDEEVQVIIRMIDSTIDVFYTKCLFGDTKLLDNGVSRTILKLVPNSNSNIAKREHERRSASSATLTLECFTYDDTTIKFQVRIDNIGIGGMTASVNRPTKGIQIIPGQILYSNEPKIPFLVIWSDNSTFGLKVLVGDPKLFSEWNQYLELVSPALDRKSFVSRRELAALLTHSGLLKGSRRSPFGAILKDHLVTNKSKESILLTQRRIIDDEYGNPILHVNLKRVSEQSWLFADGASLTEKKGKYVDMLFASIQTAKATMQKSEMFPRYLSFIWQKAVTSTTEFADAISTQSHSRVVDSCQLSISSQNEFSSTSKENESKKAARINELSAPDRRKIASSFTPELYEAFVGFDGSHPILNAELAKFGPYHHTVTKCVQVQDQTIIAHRIKTHSVWSSTGVSNSVFVVIPKHFTPRNLPVALSFLIEDSISFGTDDFLLIFDGDEGASQPFIPYLSNPKMFSFLVHDLLLNQALSYHDDFSKQDTAAPKTEE
ncbi:MAG: hypothetical protein NT027_20285 [Proteobacteria bacterium]|nr:hypothetical protein [Pseudomonadota bacterium]